MADQSDPDIPEVLGGQARQHLGVNRAVAKRRRILFETQPAQPIGDIKRHRQPSLVLSVARRRQFGVGSCGPRTFDASIAGSSPIWNGSLTSIRDVPSALKKRSYLHGVASGSIRTRSSRPEHAARH